ncbi:uncharacterized protein [Clinocottus analis]|uniref:uncharacterized protein n=1 Tax=Clinocottus analis TaxID=304258 RepID=UPI0035C0C80E
MSSCAMQTSRISEEVMDLTELFQDLTINPEMSSCVTRKRTFSEVPNSLKKRMKLNRTHQLDSATGDVHRVRKIFPRISYPAPSPVSVKSQEKKKNPKGPRTKIWIMGSGYVLRAEREAYQNFGENLGLSAKVEWFGQGEMRWSGVQQRFDAELKTQSPPDILIIHAGGNDLGLTSAKILSAKITSGLMALHARFPSMTIGYSCINERQEWRYGHPEGMDYDRNTVNKCIKAAVGKFGGEVIEHPNLRCDDKTLFLSDGVHFSNYGNKIFLTRIHSVLKKILERRHQ